jgi:hypothetical protein
MGEVNYLGRVISLKNDSGSDLSPNRLVVIKAGGTMKKPTGEGAEVTGVLLKDLRYEYGKVSDGLMGSVQIDGIVDIVCKGAVVANDYLIASSDLDTVKPIGLLSSLSLGAEGDPLVKIVGIATEAADDGGLVATLLQPMIIAVA